jgi:hypothetical protein
MAIFNITPNILNHAREYDPYARGTISSALSQIEDWLEENVGEYCGPGNDGFSDNVVSIGLGWEVFSLYNGKPTRPDRMDAEVTWHVDITDEQKSVLFALRWTE